MGHILFYFKMFDVIYFVANQSYLIGSPKYWLAIPTVAPVMQMTMDTL